MADRTPRENATRELESRKRPWEMSSILPDPPAEPGWKFRWIRASVFAEPDNSNVNTRFRDGWTPVKADQYRDLAQMRDARAQFSDSIEIGGLVLCKMPEEDAKARNEYFAEKAKQQLRSVNAALNQEQDRRMPTMFNESVSRET